mmetsp:Transcript_970/g.1517  ORF Transcript_970/g.1517 Transcript_970/m.1517 type:complete len:111 (+) Transcript_970:364-696(+)
MKKVSGSEQGSTQQVANLPLEGQEHILAVDQATHNSQSSRNVTQNNKSSNNMLEDAEEQNEAFQRALGVAFLSPLRYYHRAPIPRFSYGLDSEERELIARGQGLGKQEIW